MTNDQTDWAVPAISALAIFAGVLADLYATCRQVHYRDGQVLLASGAPADKLIVLVRGTVEIRARDVFIATRTAVRVLGEAPPH